MKKIILLIITIFVLSSCGGGDSKINTDNNNKDLKSKEKIENNSGAIIIKKNILNSIPKGDIREKTDYPINFTGIQTKYFNKNNDIGLLLTYIGNMEYQGFLEKKEKKYSQIIIKMGEEFIKQNENKLSGYEKTISLPKLFIIIGNNYEIIGDNEKAINSYKKAIKINPSEYNTYIQLGELYKKIGENKKYEENFKKAKNIIEKNKIIEKINNKINIFGKNDYYGGYMELAEIYNLLSQKEKSKINFEKANKIITNGTFFNEYEKNKNLFNFNKIKFN